MDATPQAPEGTTGQDPFSDLSDLLPVDNGWSNFVWNQSTFQNQPQGAQDGPNANQQPPRSAPLQQWLAPHDGQPNLGDCVTDQHISSPADIWSSTFVPESVNDPSLLQLNATPSFAPGPLFSMTAGFEMDNDTTYLPAANPDMSYQPTSANDVSFTDTTAVFQTLNTALVQYAEGMRASEGLDAVFLPWTAPGATATANPSSNVTSFQNGQAFDPFTPGSAFDRNITPAVNETTQYNINQGQATTQKDVAVESYHLRNDSGITVSNMAQEIIPALRTHAKESRASTSTKRPRAKKNESEPLTFAIVCSDPATCSMKGKITKPRRAFDTQRRKEVGEVRKIGACFRCKMWNVSCGVAEPCERCTTAAEKTDCSANMLCFRPNVQDCGFFREASTVHSKPVTSAMNWITSTTAMLQFFVAPPTWNSKPLEIPCRHFSPREHDIVIKHIGGSDVDKHLVIPAYAAVDLSYVKREIQNNIRHYTEVFFDNTIKTESLAIVQRTLEMAMDYSAKNPSSFVSAALNIWTGSKLCATERSLTGAEVLGLSPVDDPKSHLYGHIPIPPVLDHQCDTMAIDWMKDLTSQLLKKLSLKIQNKKNRAQWFEIFLTMFVLLNNLEYVYGIQSAFTEYLGRTATFGSHVRKTSEKYINKWTWSCGNLLFMYKAYFRNTSPFRPENRERAVSEGNLDAQAQAYFDDVVGLLSSIESNARSVADVTDNKYEMVWCKSLFLLDKGNTP